MLPEYPELARLVFRELDGGGTVRAEELPPGIDANTFTWARELVRRYRLTLSAFDATQAVIRNYRP
jgi:hypothetical protein